MFVEFVFKVEGGYGFWGDERDVLLWGVLGYWVNCYVVYRFEKYVDFLVFYFECCNGGIDVWIVWVFVYYLDVYVG